MAPPILITAQDEQIKQLDFRPYCYEPAVERAAVQFLPEPDEPQEMTLVTPSGEELVASVGDYIVNDVGRPTNRWPVKPDIFEQTYQQIHPGVYIKIAMVDLIPLWDVVGGNKKQIVTVRTLEGDETVRAGDFYLARGVNGEIWPFPKDSVGKTVVPIEKLE